MSVLSVTAPSRAGAQSLILTFIPTSETGAAGTTIIFKGRVTNTTGLSLNASDIFLNFDSFDPTVFSDLTQLLGDPDFLLPNNTFSSVVDIFSAFIANTAGAGPYDITVSLQDVNNFVSDPVTPTAEVTAGGNVPEPSTVVLVATGFLGVVGGSTYRRRRSKNAQTSHADVLEVRKMPAV